MQMLKNINHRRYTPRPDAEAARAKDVMHFCA